jgi:hypothetical protein
MEGFNMSNHWDWSKRVIAEAKETKLFAPENGESLKFSIGQNVIYTNDCGCEFKLKITGFYVKDDSLYACGSRYLLDWSCPWMPEKEANLRACD